MTHFLQLFPVSLLLWLGNCQPGKYHRLVPASKLAPFWLSSLAYGTKPQGPAPNARVQLPICRQALSSQHARVHRDAAPKHEPRAFIPSTRISWVHGCIRHTSSKWELKKMQALPFRRSQLVRELVMKTSPEINIRTSQVFSEHRGGNNYFCWDDQERLSEVSGAETGM